VRSCADELARFIRAAVVTYRLDPARLYALGYSNGANIASTVMLVEPGILRASILLRPMLVYEPPEQNDLSASAVFISAGRMDPIVPVESVERLAILFESAHADVTIKWQLAGHSLVPSEVREAADWLALQRTRV
jgi:predicted esterase